MSTLLLILVDEGKVSLGDKVSTWLPDLPHADEVTLSQLARMTSGYVDFEQTSELTAANYADPYKQWTPQELLAFAVDQPLCYPPGTNWNYAHTNCVILGLALERSPPSGARPGARPGACPGACPGPWPRARSGPPICTTSA